MTTQQARNWMFTINNPTQADRVLTHWLQPKAKFYAAQHEIGEEGTHHIQGYVIFKGNQRMAGLKKLHPKAHWEIRRGTHEQAVAYCTKQDTRMPDATPTVWGDPPAPGKRSDLLAMKEFIDSNPRITMEEVYDQHFATALRYSAHIKEYIALKAVKRNWKSIVTVITGPPGTGKTRLCHDVSPSAYVKDATSKWWDNYDGTSDVILDDFYGGIQHTTMLALLDRYHCQVECKGGVINFAPQRIFITSNKPFNEWYARPEGISDDAWEAKIAAIERRIDNLILMPTLGTSTVIKGELPAIPIVIPPILLSTEKLPETPVVTDEDDLSPVPISHLYDIGDSGEDMIISDDGCDFLPASQMRRANEMHLRYSFDGSRVAKKRRLYSPPVSDSSDHEYLSEDSD